MSDQIALDDVPLAALVVDVDGQVTGANAAAAELTGRPADQLAGAELAELLPDLASPGLVLVAEELSMRHAEGCRVAVVVDRRPRRDVTGAVVGSVLTMRPAQQGRQGPTGMEVVSTVSHELRSPLTSVKGYTSLLLSRWDRLSDEQKKTMLEQVHHDADRVTRLVNELLDISRLETGHLQLRRQMVGLPGLAASVVAKLAMEYPDLECDVIFPVGFPSVPADPDKVEQVLTNLVENAAKYASPEHVQVSGAVDGDTVAVAVTDTGDGIPAGDLPNIFAKFYRSDQGRPSGSGLGLWISRGLVEAHGGQLSARSVVGEGSVFSFTLPLGPRADG
ncbi:MAG: sensor histidine kinase [Acidimicrobiales bacterium]